MTSNPMLLRRHSDRVMNRRIFLSAMVAIAINLLAFYALFQEHIIVRLFPAQAMDPYDYYDRVLAFLFVALTTILFLVVLYNWKVRRLLRDVQRIAKERDKEREIRIRRQKLESLGLLAAGISHEINSSLQAILGSCEMAQNRIKDPEKCKEFIQRAVDNSLHARRVVGNVLTFSNASDTHGTEKHDLEEIMQESIDYSRAFLPSSLKVRESYQPGLKINIDRVGFVQVVSNLVNNAAQAMNHKGEVKVASGKVVMGAETPENDVPPGTYAYVKVRDSGRGIKPEDLDKIFDPFFTTKKIGEGTGLGLSIVHGLVKSMNGHITVHSIVEVGSEFTLYFPLIEVQEAQ